MARKPHGNSSIEFQISRCASHSGSCSVLRFLKMQKTKSTTFSLGKALSIFQKGLRQGCMSSPQLMMAARAEQQTLITSCVLYLCFSQTTKIPSSTVGGGGGEGGNDNWATGNTLCIVRAGLPGFQADRDLRDPEQGSPYGPPTARRSRQGGSPACALSTLSSETPQGTSRAASHPRLPTPTRLHVLAGIWNLRF